MYPYFNAAREVKKFRYNCIVQVFNGLRLRLGNCCRAPLDGVVIKVKELNHVDYWLYQLHGLCVDLGGGGESFKLSSLSLAGNE